VGVRLALLLALNYTYRVKYVSVGFLRQRHLFMLDSSSSKGHCTEHAIYQNSCYNGICSNFDHVGVLTFPRAQSWSRNGSFKTSIGRLPQTKMLSLNENDLVLAGFRPISETVEVASRFGVAVSGISGRQYRNLGGIAPSA